MGIPIYKEFLNKTKCVEFVMEVKYVSAHYNEMQEGLRKELHSEKTYQKSLYRGRLLK